MSTGKGPFTTANIDCSSYEPWTKFVLYPLIGPHQNPISSPIGPQPNCDSSSYGRPHRETGSATAPLEVKAPKPLEVNIYIYILGVM